MEHVVFFPGPDGSPAFRRTGSLEEAVRFVEHLRNAEGVGEVSVHALSEVPLAFRTYVRVEVPGEAAQPVAEAQAEVAQPVAELPVEPVAFPVEPVESVEPVAEAPVEPLPVLAEDIVPAARSEEPSLNGKRSLGFFAS
jgi:hypothetical protein